MPPETKPKRQRGRPKKDTKVVYRRVPTYMYDLIIHTIEELISKFTKAN